MVKLPSAAGTAFVRSTTNRSEEARETAGRGPGRSAGRSWSTAILTGLPAGSA